MTTTANITTANITPGKFMIRSLPLNQLFAVNGTQAMVGALPMGGVSNVLPEVETALSAASNVNFMHHWIFKAVPGTSAFKIQSRASGQYLFCDSAGRVGAYGDNKGNLGTFDGDHARWIVEVVPDSRKPTVGPFSSPLFTECPWVSLKNVGTGKYLTVVMAGGTAYLGCVGTTADPEANVMDINAMFRLRRAGKVKVTFEMLTKPEIGDAIHAQLFDITNKSKDPINQEAGTLRFTDEAEVETHWSQTTGVEFTFEQSFNSKSGEEALGLEVEAGVKSAQKLSMEITTGARNTTKVTREFTWKPTINIDANSRSTGAITLSTAARDLEFLATFTDEDGSWQEKGMITARGLVYFLNIEQDMRAFA